MEPTIQKEKRSKKRMGMVGVLAYLAVGGLLSVTYIYIYEMNYIILTSIY